MVSALYIDSRGPYVGLPGVDPWPLDRDAMLYSGPHPVVAHPPCGPWGRLAMLCTKQDPTTGPRAVEQVIRWGGILEHPAGSMLWSSQKRSEITGPDLLGDLPRPGELDLYGRGLFTIEVDQCRWGHKARKRTWLLFAGLHPGAVGTLPSWRPPTHVIDSSSSSKRAGTDKGRHLPKSLRHLTPPRFARWLICLAGLALPEHDR